MKTSDFDFYLPKNLIASRPVNRRDSSRLLVLHRDGMIEHRNFSDIIEYMNKGDILILNNTKVFPARVFAQKNSGGKINILFIGQKNGNGIWDVMYRGSYTGVVTIGGCINAEVWTEEVMGQESEVKRTRKFLRFLNIEPSNSEEVLWRFGYMPLPPYINRMPDEDDKIRYQTVYAKKQGSIAAPTAGLHFTEDLIERIKDKGVYVEELTLHVGPGTFRLIHSESITGHRMDAEYFEMSYQLLNRIEDVKKSGNRIFTVGTTTTRAIEGYFSNNWLKSKSQNEKITDNGSVKGYTDIFIYPGYKFKVVDSLITNFHLPRSTPLMLISAFCGFDIVINAYNEAISMGYRFFSYGDAMLAL